VSPRILALDTTTEACSVALGQDGVVARRWLRLPRGHSSRILPLVEEVLGEAGWSRSQIDVIAFCRGPGSFTGVRIAAGVVQGLALGLDRPVVPLSTLRTIAQGAMDVGPGTAVAAAIDARMGEVYFGAFVRGDGGLAEAVTEEVVCAPEAVRLPKPDAGPWYGAGTGFTAYPGLLADRLAGVDPDRLPDVADVIAIARAETEAGRAMPAEAATPVYLRNRVAERPKSVPGS